LQPFEKQIGLTDYELQANISYCTSPSLSPPSSLSLFDEAVHRASGCEQKTRVPKAGIQYLKYKQPVV